MTNQTSTKKRPPKKMTNQTSTKKCPPKKKSKRTIGRRKNVHQNLVYPMDVCDFAAPAAETLNKISLGDKKFGAKREWKKWVECNGRKIDNQCPNNSAHTDNWGSKAREAKPVNLTYTLI